MEARFTVLELSQHLRLPTVLLRQSHPHRCFLPSAISAPYSLCFSKVISTWSQGQDARLDKAPLNTGHLFRSNKAACVGALASLELRQSTSFVLDSTHLEDIVLGHGSNDPVICGVPCKV